MGTYKNFVNYKNTFCIFYENVIFALVKISVARGWENDRFISCANFACDPFQYNI